MNQNSRIPVSASLRLLLASTMLGSTAFAELSAPSGVDATDGDSTDAVDVSWLAVEGAAGYRVFRALPGEAFEEIVSTSDTLHRDTTAAIGTTYEYRVVAFDDVEESPASEIDSGWRNAVAPTPFEASDGTVPGGVELTWLPSEGAIGYVVYRLAGNGNGPPQPIGATEETSFLYTQIPTGQVRTFTARAVTESGFSDFAEPDTGFSGLPAPQNLRASDGQFTRWVLLRWRPVPQSDGYRVLRAAEGEDEVEIAVSAAPVYKDETATPGVLYTYRVAALLGDGVTAESEPDTGWRGLPRPLGLTASDGSSTTQIDLEWPEVPGATTYRLEHRLPGTSWALLAEVDTTVYVDTTSPIGIQVRYRLTALVGELESRPGTPETGWRNVDAPTGLAASDGTYLDRVEIVWNASPEESVIGYDIYRRLSTDPEGLLIASIEADESPVFNDTEIEPEVIGTYWVCAVVRPGCSATSDSDTGFRAAPSGFGASTDGSGAALPPGISGAPAPGGAADDGVADRTAPGAGPGVSSAAGPASDRVDTDSRHEPSDAKESAVPSDETTEPQLDANCDALWWRLNLLIALEFEFGLGDGGALLTAMLTIESSDSDRIDPCSIWHGDIDGDGRVDRSDLEAFLAAVEIDDRLRGDLDRDGVIGPLDLAHLIERIDMAAAPR